MNETNPLRTLRALKGAPLSVLVALKLSSQPALQEWLESTTGYSDKTIRKALFYLQEIGLVHGSLETGWEVGGVPLAIAEEIPKTEDANPKKALQAGRNVTTEKDERNFSAEVTEEEDEEEVLRFKQDLESSSSPPRVLEAEQRKNSAERSEMQSPEPGVGAEARQVIGRLLRAAGVMPGEIAPILADASIGLEDVLAEMAYCYTPVNGIRLPDRIIGRNLLEGHRPPADYYEHTQGVIPPAVLKKAGLEGLIPAPHLPELEPGGEGEEAAASLSRHPPPPPDDSVHKTLEGCRLTPWQAWERAKEQLSLELPRAACAAYLEPACLRAFREGEFVVDVEGAYAREWLESRLTSTLERVLSGICGRRVGVRFESYQFLPSP